MRQCRCTPPLQHVVHTTSHNDCGGCWLHFPPPAGCWLPWQSAQVTRATLLSNPYTAVVTSPAPASLSFSGVATTTVLKQWAFFRALTRFITCANTSTDWICLSIVGSSQCNLVMLFRVLAPSVDSGLEDGDSMFCRNFGIYRLAYMAPKPRTTVSSHSATSCFVWMRISSFTLCEERGSKESDNRAAKKKNVWG
jgi:hypothetical protein